MKRLINKFLADRRIRYLIVGGSCAILEYLLFLGIEILSGWLIFANVTSFIVGLLMSFILHKLWSFSGDQARTGSTQLTGYVALALVNAVLSSALIYVIVEIFGWTPWIGKAVTMGLVVCWNYVLLNKIIFKRGIEEA